MFVRRRAKLWQKIIVSLCIVSMMFTFVAPSLAIDETQAPEWAADAALAVSDVTDSSFGVMWPEAAGADSYIIVVNSTGDNVSEVVYDTTSDLEYVVNGLTAESSYDVEVTAANSAGYSTSSLVTEVLTEAQSAEGGSGVNPDETQLPEWAAEAALTVSEVTSSSFKTSWPEASGAESYKLLLTNCSDSVTDVVYDITDLEYIVSGLTAATNYDVEVMAANSAGDSTTSLTATVTTEEEISSVSPAWESGVELTVSNIIETGFDLSWPEAVGAESYQVEVSNTTGGVTTEALNTTIADGTSCAVTGLDASYRYDIQVTAVNTAGQSATSLDSMVVTAVSGNTFELVSLSLNEAGKGKFQPDATQDNGRSTDYENVFTYDTAVKPDSNVFEWYIQGGFNNGLTAIDTDIKSFRLFNLTDGREIDLDYGDLNAEVANLGLNTNPNEWDDPTTLTTGDFIVTRLMAPIIRQAHLIIQPDIAEYLEDNKEYVITIDPQFNTGGNNPKVLGKVYRFEFETESLAPSWEPGADLTVSELTSSSFNVSWPEASGAESYQVVVSNTAGGVTTEELNTTISDGLSCAVIGLDASYRYDIQVIAVNTAGQSATSLDSMVVTAVSGNTFELVSLSLNEAGKGKFQPDATQDNGRSTDYENVFTYDTAVKPDSNVFEWYIQGGFNNGLTAIDTDIKSFRLFNLTDGREIDLDYGDLNAEVANLGLNTNPNEWDDPTTLTTGDFIVTRLMAPIIRQAHLIIQPDIAEYLEDNKEYVITIDPQFNTGGNNPKVLAKVYRFEFSTSTADTQAPEWGADAQITVGEITVDSIALSWPEASDDTVVASYRITVTDNDGNESNTETVDNSTSYVVSGLTSNTQYSFTVSALDAARNESSALEAVSAETLPAVPVWPEDATLTADSVMATELVLRWPQVSNTNDLAGYKVYVDGVEDDSLPAIQNYYELYGLSSGIKYILSVKPFNELGELGEAIETMVVTPGAGGLTFTLTPTAIDEGEDGYYHNYEIVNPVDMDNFSLAWNFSNGLDKNLRFNLECIRLIDVSTDQEITLDLGPNSYESTLEGVFFAGDFKYISAGGGTGDGTGDGTGGDASKVRMLKFEPGAKTLNDMNKGSQYIIEIDPEFTANNGRNTLGKIFTFSFTTAVDDTEAPAWPAGAQLTASNVGTDALVLSWPEASDNIGIAEYSLYQQGETLELIQSFGTATTSYKMEALNPNTTYNFVLRGRDAKSNYTPDLTLSVTTLLTDDQAPIWPVGSKLTADNVLTDNLDLNWTIAEDNVEVTGYRLLKNGSTVADLDAGIFTYHVGQLTPTTAYIFAVEARDKVGNYSTDGPKLAISTLEGEADTEPPYWTDSGYFSTARAMRYDKTYVTYEWPWAADNVAVTGYLVYKNDVHIATVDAYTNSYSDALDIDASYYTYTVCAVDAAGNISEGHSMSVYSGNPDQDIYSPVWPADTSITFSAFTDNTVYIEWTPARDNVGVTGYVVIKDGLWITSAGEDGLLYDHTQIAGADALVSGETYIFSIKAFDFPQNGSKGDPKITVVMGTDPTAGAGIPFSLANVDNSRGSLNSITGALNQVLAAQDPENIKFTWEFEELLADGYQSKISLSNLDTGEMITLDPADIVYSENEGKGLLTLDLAKTSLKLLDTTQYAVKLDKTLATQGGKQLGFDIAWKFSTDVADKKAPYWGEEDVLNVSFDKAPAIATLSWPSAADNVAVTQYKVYQGDEMLAALSANDFTYDVEGLAVNTAYTFKVVAGDYLENFSYPLTQPATTPAADATAPEWQDGDELTFTDITSDHLTVTWPGAVDNYQVENYKIYLDGAGEPVAEVAADVLSYIITGLAGETTYNVAVRAFDYTANTADLTGSVITIIDQVNPLWPEGSTLQAKDIKDTSVTLYWDAATDNVGVTRYNIYSNGEKVQTVAGDITEASVTGLSGSTEYTFAVEAEDLKENKSADQLTLVQWTAPGSITAGAAFPFNLDQPLSHNIGYDADSNTLNNAVDGSFTKNNVAFTFSFATELADDTWLNNIELQDGDETAIPLYSDDFSAFTYLEMVDKLKIVIPASLVSDGQYVLTVKDNLQAADGTLLGRSFTWTFNVSVGPYGVTDIAAGYNSYSSRELPSDRYYLMLKDDGSVWTWGNNDYGTLGDGTTDARDIPTRVETLDNIVALEAGRDSCFALDQDGAVWAWGSNEQGQLGKGTEPSGTSGRYGNHVPEKVIGLPVAIQKLHYGYGSVAALDENGEVWIWGFAAQEGISTTAQRSGTPIKVDGLSDIIDVATGYRMFMAVSGDGDVYSFQKGNAPAKVSGLSEIVAVDAEGIDNSDTDRMALKTDGTAYIWGGGNNIKPAISTPTRVEDATLVKAVIADGPYVLGTDGQVTCVTHSTEPALGEQISGLNNVVKLASSANGGLALQTNGTLLQFIGTEVNEVPLNMDPVDVPVWPEDSTIEITNQAETGLTLNWQNPDPEVSTFAIYQDGTLVTTVSGNTSSYDVLELTKGQTYTFKLQARFVNSGWSVNGPETSATLTDWNPTMQGAGKLAMSPGHTLMIGDDGSVWAWGQNEFGQLGIGNNDEQLIPVKISGLANITAVAVGDNHSLALDQDGNVWAWGRNDGYQLGNNTTTDSNIPLKIISSDDIKAIAAAADHNIVLKDDGTVLGWGDEPDGPPDFYSLSDIDGHKPGQLYYGTKSPSVNYPLTGVKGIATSRMFSAYLFDDGRVCRIGRFVETKGSTTWTAMKNYSAPLGIVAIAAGENFVVALREDGSVVTVGDNDAGQYGNGTQGNGTPAEPTPYGVVSGLDNVVAVAAGGYHSLALDQDGNVYTWGKNLYGQLGTGKTNIHLTPVKVAGLTDIAAIGGGTESSIAFRNMSKVYVWGRNNNGQLGNDSKVDSKVPTLVQMAGYSEDIDAPTWPAYFALIATDITESSVTLLWTPANDDIGVTAYEIYVNGDKKAEVNGTTQEYVLDDLTANTSYTFGIKARDAVGNTSVMSKTISATMEDSLIKVSPTLTADITNNIPGQPIDITFSDDETWRDAIVGITVNGTLIETSGYEISAGKITIKGIVFNEVKNYSIIVKATGYEDASITQTINSPPAPITAPKLQLAAITSKGDISLTFDKEMADPSGTESQFTVAVNGTPVTVTSVVKTNTPEKIKLELVSNVTGADGISIRYTRSSDPAIQLKSADGGIVESFSTQIGEALATPPALKKDISDNHVGNSVDITFVDDAAWRNAISDITIDGTSISGKYTISDGKITINAGLFTEARDYEIVVKATGYNDAGVTQKMYKVINESSVTVDESNKNMAVTSTTPAATVTIPEDVSDATINVGDLLNAPANGAVETAALPALTVAADTSIHDNPVQVEIPAGTTVSAPEGWDGTINVPTVQANNSVTVNPDSGKKATVKAVIEVGFGDVPLTFSKAVKLVIPGQAGKDVGYYQNGNFTKITRVCDENSQEWADANLPAGGEGKIDAGQDLVIWTKHFTQFVTYEQTSTKDDDEDTIAPTWPAGSTLSCDKSSSEADLTWTAAYDNVGVRYYCFFIDDEGSSIFEVSGTKTTYHTTELPTGEHKIRVEAVDAEGNMSTRGPTADFGGNNDDQDFKVSFTLQSNAYNDTVLQFDFTNGLMSDSQEGSILPDSIDQNITIYRQSDNSQIEYSSYKYTKDGSTDNPPKIRRLELYLDELETGATYVIEFGPDLAANNGKTLGKTYTWKFTTDETSNSIGSPSTTVGPETAEEGIVPGAVPAAAGMGALSDISGHWGEADIQHMLTSGAMNGYPDGTFRPDNTITRAEFAVVLVKALGLELQTGIVFSDTVNHWAKDYIATAVACGIITGYDAQTFGPDDPITREQMAVMINRAEQLTTVEAVMSFIDADQISVWAREAVGLVSGHQIMSGYPDNSFRPADFASRAEAAAVVVNIM